ncbi:MAG: hypothetical protein FWC43_01405 [Planctomycetaceae bacterium]|nr:hypothetical protein [Planctomycetaceae bacterium]
MKRLFMCVVALVVGIFLVAYIGCDSITAVAKDKKNQLEKYLKDKTVLERARVQLVDAKKSRTKLKEIADKFYIDSEVAIKQAKRLEEEKSNTVEAFEKLQDAARKAELPKLVDATAEDKAKTIQVGTKTFTGEEIYRVLKEYKTQVEKANSTVERERKRSEFLKDRTEKIRSQMARVDDNIMEMERQIDDFELFQELLAANKRIDDLGLSDDKMNELLNTDSILSELRKKVDETDIQIGMKDFEDKITGLKQELRSGTSFTITGDDLI